MCTTKAIDVAVAEFNALRSELLSRSATQSALVGVGFAAIGIIYSSALGDRGDQGLLLAIPFIAAAAILAYAGEGFKINAIGSYIRDQLWPFLQARTDAALPSWEHHLYLGRRDIKRSLITAPIGALFYIVGMTAAVYPSPVALWTRVLAAVVLTAASTIAIALMFIGRARNAA